MARFLADPALRRRITAVTNKVEGFNGFSGWLRFGNDGVIVLNDPAEQEKMIKFNSLWPTAGRASRARTSPPKTSRNSPPT
ncbi:Tn3 family transposase [Nonomuraea wenchangensis]|uniref:Tn3 family transposase n=1 Tax=Nonomuraea wenchangensis TaxID=568860 RepID=UPI00343C8301